MKSLSLVIASLACLLAGPAFAADFGMWDLSVGKVVTPTTYAAFDPAAPNVKIVGAATSFAGSPDVPIADPFAYHQVASGDLTALGNAVYHNDGVINFVPPGPDAVAAGFPDTGFLYVSHLVSDPDGSWHYKCQLYPAVATSDPTNSVLVSQTDLVNAFVNNTTTFP
ncbi:hypothetical protein [Geomesophilobacter sediminis]|uniref:Uncharacterized protein n=1 Tax=Geomesophilobacter sediminis TaxID=2798584 RepID=A0A8J7M1C3_9BACT|nr:hypothetical protein [Geomesophilobacter sediminis]MBJ6726863.1 hypothetical protein [Geomesophilobacter sediminis]